MANYLVSGLINIETTLQVDRFPVVYSPVEYPFFSVDASVSGVGYNITKALTRLGNRVNFLSLLGQDLAVASIREEITANYINDQYVVESAAQTARSIIIYDEEGRRKIYVDLKDQQEQRYPYGIVEKVMPNTDLAILCNINYTRKMIPLAQKNGKAIATDIHAISSLDDEYNQDYMHAADILFMSNDLLPMPEEEWAKEIMAKLSPEIFVIGMGKAGAYMAVKKDDYYGQFPAHDIRPVISSIGAGDALFSAFIHSYMLTQDPYEAIRKANIFASYKVGAKSASSGFLSSSRLNEMYEEKSPA
ncbi:MAG: carbohydrate kinase family protein [Chloroflexota bacterium]